MSGIIRVDSELVSAGENETKANIQKMVELAKKAGIRFDPSALKHRSDFGDEASKISRGYVAANTTMAMEVVIEEIHRLQDEIDLEPNLDKRLRLRDALNITISSHVKLAEVQLKCAEIGGAKANGNKKQSALAEVHTDVAYVQVANHVPATPKQVESGNVSVA